MRRDAVVLFNSIHKSVISLRAKSASYWYEGNCPQTGQRLKLPRTLLAEAIARDLMQQLAGDEQHSREGKMYGILLVEAPAGEQRVLKAFSGLLNGNRVVEGWVPPIPGRDQVALEETRTLAVLDSLKQELIQLQHLPERQQYDARCRELETHLQELDHTHRHRKHNRQQQRQQLLQTLQGDDLANALTQLNDQSRWDGIERRRLKAEWNALLQPLQTVIEQADARVRALKQQRKALSRSLQDQMYRAYCLTNFSGESRSLQQLMPDGFLPTGTGDCCAPKLLHYAATQQLKPLALAEFWWGPPPANEDKVQGAFYGACAERCQPLMGFLLSGLPVAAGIEDGATELLPILYEDEWLIAVNKPAGLLSVPGRTRDRQDSVLTRLRHLLPESSYLTAVHRLDQDTSGVLVLARDLHTYRHLSRQFQQRQVHKVYEAILAGTLSEDSVTIDLPLWGDPDDRPRQKVDRQRGKPSVTQVRVMARMENSTRVEFSPITGRTHQLRVHAADLQGLGMPILGDRLYGSGASASRLHLHARELRIQHPQSGQMLHLRADTPF